MKWWPQPLRPGDMIRACFGNGPLYHYGIFVSEQEVIQFGPLPTAQALRDSGGFCVMATDIDAFCGGAIVEVACPETREERARLSVEETVRRARAALGTTGYDLIHNNCEHFAHECVYGVKRSLQAEEARRRWYSRPILNVYVLPFGEDLAVEPVYPPRRNAEIAAATGIVRRQKYAAWRALEAGLAHAFHTDIRELSFRRTHAGKWTSDKYAFSISHTEGAVAVAVSNAAVGVDLENATAFTARHAQTLPALCRDTLTERERAACPDALSFLGLWTRKECLFKHHGKGRFSPRKLSVESPTIHTVSFDLELPEVTPFVLSATGDHVNALSIYRLDGDRPCRLHAQNREFDLQ